MSNPPEASGSATPPFASGSTPAAARTGHALACGLPFVAYLFTLSGHSYWLDAGEFVAVAVNLDIAHPPGHPLFAVYGKLWSLLPLGSLPFRVALGQAVAAAIAAGFLYRACLATAAALGAGTEWAARSAALAGTWLWSLSFGVWFQAVRPEVYALQGLVLLAAVDRMLRLQLDAARDPRPLYAATFAVGLGLTNHHLMSFLLLPALLFCAWTVARRRGVRPIATCAALGLLALLVYVYLPVRAARNPPANFGAPLTLENFIWVISARVYAKNVGSHDPEPFDQRFVDMIVALATDLHALPLLAAVAGLYVMLRSARTRSAGVLWFAVAATAIGVRSWLGSVRGNPDALGYAIAGTAALAGLSSAALAALIVLLRRHLRSRVPALLLATLCAAAMVALQLGGARARADLSRFRATDVFDEYRLRQLPTRTVLIAATPQAVFRHLESSATESVRPDLTVVPVPFLRYPGVAAALMQAHPDVRPLVQRFLAADALELDALLQLAATRPVFTELEAHIPPATYRGLLPAGILYAVVTPPIVARVLPRSAVFQRGIERTIVARLGRDLAEPETARQWLWVRYMDALYYAAHGQRELAREAVAEAVRLFPDDAHVRALQRALAATHGPLDVRPFLGHAAPP